MLLFLFARLSLVFATLQSTGQMEPRNSRTSQKMQRLKALLRWSGIDYFRSEEPWWVDVTSIVVYLCLPS